MSSRGISSQLGGEALRAACRVSNDSFRTSHSVIVIAPCNRTRFAFWTETLKSDARFSGPARPAKGRPALRSLLSRLAVCDQ